MSEDPAARFRDSGLADLETLWTLEGEWIEPPNERRGGWSGVQRLTVPGIGRVIVKRQRDHLTRSLRHPLGEPTLAREARGLEAFRQAGLGVPETLFFGTDRAGEGRRAVLVLTELTGHRGLDEILASEPGPGRRRGLARTVARAVRRIHDHDLRHGALYPKHVFVDEDEDVRFIDLETARRSRRAGANRMRDLDTLARRTPWASRTDRLRFLGAYLDRPARDPDTRALWRKLDTYGRRRGARQRPRPRVP